MRLEERHSAVAKWAKFSSLSIKNIQLRVTVAETLSEACLRLARVLACDESAPPTRKSTAFGPDAPRLALVYGALLLCLNGATDFRGRLDDSSAAAPHL